MSFATAWHRESRPGRIGFVLVAATLLVFAVLLGASLGFRDGDPIAYPVSMGTLLIPIGMICAVVGFFQPGRTQRAGLASIVLGGGVLLLMAATGYPRYRVASIVIYVLVISGLVIGLRRVQRL